MTGGAGNRRRAPALPDARQLSDAPARAQNPIPNGAGGPRETRAPPLLRARVERLGGRATGRLPERESEGGKNGSASTLLQWVLLRLGPAFPGETAGRRRHPKTYPTQNKSPLRSRRKVPTSHSLQPKTLPSQSPITPGFSLFQKQMQTYRTFHFIKRNTTFLLYTIISHFQPIRLRWHSSLCVYINNGGNILNGKEKRIRHLNCILLNLHMFRVLCQQWNLNVQTT